MKPLPWILAGIGLGAAIVYIVLNQPESAYNTGYDSVDEAAGRTALWGTKQRATGAGTGVLGKIKQGVGNLTGNDDLAGEGAADQAVGSVKDTVGQLGQAAGKTLHDLNK